MVYCALIFEGQPEFELAVDSTDLDVTRRALIYMSTPPPPRPPPQGIKRGPQL